MYACMKDYKCFACYAGTCYTRTAEINIGVLVVYECKEHGGTKPAPKKLSKRGNFG